MLYSPLAHDVQRNTISFAREASMVILTHVLLMALGSFYDMVPVLAQSEGDRPRVIPGLLVSYLPVMAFFVIVIHGRHGGILLPI